MVISLAMRKNNINNISRQSTQSELLNVEVKKSVALLMVFILKNHGYISSAMLIDNCGNTHRQSFPKGGGGILVQCLQYFQ